MNFHLKFNLIKVKDKIGISFQIQIDNIYCIPMRFLFKFNCFLGVILEFEF